MISGDLCPKWIFPQFCPSSVVYLILEDTSCLHKLRCGLNSAWSWNCWRIATRDWRWTGSASWNDCGGLNSSPRCRWKQSRGAEFSPQQPWTQACSSFSSRPPASSCWLGRLVVALFARFAIACEIWPDLREHPHPLDFLEELKTWDRPETSPAPVTFPLNSRWRCSFLDLTKDFVY